MPKRIPISAAKKVADDHACRQVILLAWDGSLTHIVTYGKSVEDCAQAAQGGNLLKEKWGWPECNDQPSRVKKLEKELVGEKQSHDAEINRIAAELGFAVPATVEQIVENIRQLIEEVRDAI